VPRYLRPLLLAKAEVLEADVGADVLDTTNLDKAEVLEADVGAEVL
jgi:hypothetical protein